MWAELLIRILAMPNALDIDFLRHVINRVNHAIIANADPVFRLGADPVYSSRQGVDR